jgi:hypothetical protein
MSLEDLLKDEVQKQINDALEEIQDDYSALRGLAGPNVESRWDFIYGYEYGFIVMGVACYYHNNIMGSRPVTKEEAKYAADQIKAIVRNRLPEIQHAISKAEAKLKDEG